MALNALGDGWCTEKITTRPVPPVARWRRVRTMDRGCVRVQTGSRLVEDQNVRAGDELHGDGHAAALPAADATGAPKDLTRVVRRCFPTFSNVVCPTCVRHFHPRGDGPGRRRLHIATDDWRRRGVFPQDLRGVPSGGSGGGAATPGVVVVRAHSRIRHRRERELVKDGERRRRLIARRREPRELKLRGVHHRLEHGEVRWEVGVVLRYVGDPPGQAPGPRRNVVQSDDAARLAHRGRGPLGRRRR